MNLMKRACLVFVAATLGWMADGRASPPSPSSRTRGAVIESARIADGARTVLLREIATARSEHPDAFKGLAELRDALPELDAAKRGRFAPMTPALKAVGRMSIYPLLEELAFSAEPQGDLTNSAWLSWRVGLIEAVGSMRDPRAAPVLFALLDAPSSDFLVMQAAAEAVAKLETDVAAARLIRLSRDHGVRRDAAVAGMGHCRTKPIVDRLVKILEEQPERALAMHAIKSLGTAANAWVWEMPVMAGAPDQAHVRETAVRALVAAFVRWDGEVREKALHGILVVDHPNTPELLAAARKDAATDELRAALDRLASRFEQNPLRTR